MLKKNKVNLLQRDDKRYGWNGDKELKCGAEVHKFGVCFVVTDETPEAQMCVQRHSTPSGRGSGSFDDMTISRSVSVDN